MPPSPWRTLGWACYLACSWTWCIGMWLPVILIRDFGWWSFPAFALPNCLGAAAMGWVLSRPGASEGVQRAHSSLILWFSVITIVFQLFFLLWIVRGDSVHQLRWPLVVFMVAYCTTRLLASKREARLGWSALVLLSSIALIVAFVRGIAGVELLSLPNPAPFPRDLLFLSPICLFGFALCPYLDSTFHNARTSLPGRSGERAFAVGFLLLFLLMIVGTLVYASTALSRDALGSPGVLPGLLVCHIAMQLGFTVAEHWNARSPSARARNVFGLDLMVLLFLLRLWQPHGKPTFDLPDEIAGLRREEFYYRLFMSFYGLIFPAYVWICMLGRWSAPPTRRHIATWLIACAVAAPMFWMGFIERVHWWLAPGLLVVLVAKLFVPRRLDPDANAGVATTRSPTNPPLAASATSD